MKYKNKPTNGRFKDLVGKKYERLKVLGYMGWVKSSVSWHCVCDCGKEVVVAGSSLQRGDTRSCGCLRKDMGSPTRTHGMSNTPTHRSYISARRRCNSERCRKRYKDRGIKFLYKDFEEFYTDLGKRPKGTSLDRIDNSKGYKPGNCRWATPAEQNSNTSANKHLSVLGERRILSHWSSRVNSAAKIDSRLRKGWPPIVAVFGIFNPKGNPKSKALQIARDSIKGKTLKQLGDSVSLKYPIGHNF